MQVLLALLAVPVSAQQLEGGVELAWERSFSVRVPGGTEGERIGAVAVDSTGDLVYLASSRAQGGAWLRALVAGGKPLWTVSDPSGGPSLFSSSAEPLLPGPDGVLYGIGSTTSRIELDGRELWRVDLQDGFAWYAGRGVLSAVDPVLFVAHEETVFVAPTPRDVFVHALDVDDGSVLWESRLDQGGSDDRLRALFESPDGGDLYVLGASGPVGSPNAFPVVIAKLDAETGAERWIRNIDVTGTSFRAEFALSGDGQTLFVAVPRFGGTLLAVETAQGSVLWSKPLAAGVGEHVRLAATPEAVVVGGAPGTMPDYPLNLSGYRASDGATLWTQSLDDPGRYLSAALIALEVSPDGRTFTIAANSTPELSSSDPGAALIAEHGLSSGAQLWSATIRGLPGSGLDGTPELEGIALDARSLRVYAGVEEPTVSLLQAYDVPALAVPRSPVSLGDGDSRTLVVRAPHDAGDLYWVLGSTGGGRSGIPLPGGLVVPLDPDDWYFTTTLIPGALFLRDSLGFLDEHGTAETRLVIPPTDDPWYVGRELTHAFLTLGGPGEVTSVSASTSVEIVE